MIAIEFRSSHNCCVCSCARARALFYAYNCIVSYHSHNLQAIKLHRNCAWAHQCYTNSVQHFFFRFSSSRWISHDTSSAEYSIHRVFNSTRSQFPHNQIHLSSFDSLLFYLLFASFLNCVHNLIHTLRLLRFNYLVEMYNMRGTAQRTQKWRKKDVTEIGCLHNARNAHAMNNE